MDLALRRVGEEIAKRVKDGQCLGLGTGSTVNCALRCIGERILGEGLTLYGMPTSYGTALLAEEIGINLIHPSSSRELDWAFDGADEVDPELRLIKGAGGALLKEKMVARRAAELVIIVTENKLVQRLGTKFPVPVEVVPEGRKYVEKQLVELGASEVVLRCSNKGFPVFTEYGNVLLDAKFSSIGNDFEVRINSLTGVVDNGLFVDFIPEVLVGAEDVLWSYQWQAGEVIKSQVNGSLIG